MGKALERTADVVIIGAGVMGTSTAYHLAKRGAGKVIVLEKNMIASGSSALSVGGIRLQFSSEANIRIMLESIEVFEHFAEEMDQEIDFRQYGYLFLTTEPQTWADFQANVALQRSLGVPVELLSREEIAERFPYLHVDDVIGGTFCPRDGYADPYSVNMGFAKQARRLGALIYENTPATGIQVVGGKVVAVETPQGTISTPVVVNTAGAWAAEIGRMVGVELPVQPYRRQVFVTAPFHKLPKEVPLVIDFEPSFYFRREGVSILMGMSDKDEPPSFNTNVDWSFLERVAERAMHRCPVLEEAGFHDGWAGLYAITPDDNAIIGRDVGGVEGFVCAVGFSGHGFQQSPAVGRILAELILDGETSFDIHEFRLERFTEGQLAGEKRVV